MKMARQREAAYGFKSFVVSENADRLGLLLRTSLLYELAGLTPFSKVWKKQATPAGRSWWVLTTLAPRIEENESGSLELWTTPDTCKGGGSTARMNGITHRPDGSYITLRLETQSKMWATPRGKFTAEEPEVWQIRNDAGKVATPPLGMQAKQWPTPHKNCTTGAGKRGDGALNLQTLVSTWPTPTVQDGENNAGASQFERNSLPLNAIVTEWRTPNARDHHPSSGKYGEEYGKKFVPQVLLAHQVQGFLQAPQEIGQVSTPNTGRLNPAFVQWLQGYPGNWFDGQTGTDEEEN
ncbi:MAG TPA: hypothetical protein VMS08_06135 [Candidatus Saccharimonadia bacterium]|nr:hypothetical protein [Candidatus Saccharimonadia bacterium]